MLSLNYDENHVCHKSALFAKRRYAECRYADCRGAIHVLGYFLRLMSLIINLFLRALKLDFYVNVLLNGAACFKN
jgi:hypothetical protein